MKKSFYYIMISVTLLALTAFVFQHTDKGERIRYHEIEFTASSIHLIKWNIKDTANTSFVQEIIDSQGRTKELRFYNSRHQLAYTGSGYYGGPIIRYDYTDNRITETYFSDENEIANDFTVSEAPYRHIYHLSGHSQITKIEQRYKMDLEWTKEGVEEAIKHLELYTDYPNESSDLTSVFGYEFAYAKLNGKNPKFIR